MIAKIGSTTAPNADRLLAIVHIEYVDEHDELNHKNFIIIIGWTSILGSQSFNGGRQNLFLFGLKAAGKKSFLFFLFYT